MNKQEKQNLTVLAKKALKEYFGFCPTLKQIVLLECYCNNNFCEYLAFKVDGINHDYQLDYGFNNNSGIMIDNIPYSLSIYNNEGVQIL